MDFPISDKRATFFMSPLRNNRNDWGKKLTGISKQVLLSSWLLISFTLDVTLRGNLYRTQIPSYVLPIQRHLSVYFFPRFPYHQFSSHIPSKSLTIEINFGHSSWIIIDVCIWLLPLLGKMNNQMHCSKFCTLEESPFTTIL